MSGGAVMSWAIPIALTLIGGLLALLRYFNDRQEKSAQTLRAEIDACQSQHTQATTALRLTIAEHRLDIAERMLNKDDFRDFSNRLEERLSRMEQKLDHLGTSPVRA